MPQTREAHAAYMREYRARRRVEDVRRRRVAAGAPADGPLEPGEVELAVREELAGLADSQPGTVAVAVTLAKLLDDPGLMPQHARTAKVLVDVLMRARSTGRPRGRLDRMRSARGLTVVRN